jgi:two-component system, OmpR family, phosphate regulon response regulator PhoB
MRAHTSIDSHSLSTIGDRMQKILVIEDSADAFQLIQRSLGEDFSLTWFNTLAAGQRAVAAEKFDLVLLDLTLPDGDGLHFCSLLRADEKYDQLPVIILSARNTTAEQIVAFRVGADDYVKKPFSAEELKARISAKLRKKTNRESESFTIRAGDIEIDQSTHQVWIGSGSERESVPFTALELKMLMYFCRQKNKVLDRNEILDAIWGTSVHVYARNVDTHVSKLRKKLGPCGDYIQSAHGRGYQFVPPEPAPFTGFAESGSIFFNTLQSC